MLPTSRRKAGKNKPLIIGAIVGGVAIVCTASIILFSLTGNEAMDEVSEDMNVSNENESFADLSNEESGDVADKPPAVESGDEVASEREYYIDFVDLAVLSNGSGIFDIHIRFPDGEDYVVVTCVEISGMTEQGFFVSLDDRENHMLSSARTDVDVYTGTQLYLARHEAEIMSGAALPDYPCNQFVLSSHMMDEKELEIVYAKRIQLEENLVKFMNQTLNR